uniref:MARVEL domain-containing protein n=1 Tax=Globodera pallida TaxID=36090 RepID=A0A183BI39_GLOPA
MCLSRVGQIAYGGLALASVGLIIGSIFTPAWRQVKANLQQGQLNQLPPLDMGLFAFACQRDNSGYINTSPIYGGNIAGNYGNINQQQQQQQQQQGMYTTAYPGQQISNNGINQAYNTLNSGYNTVTGQQQAQYATQYGSGTGATMNTVTGTRYVDMCLDWWNNQPAWEKVVICLMLVGLISAVLSLVWDLLTFCACFCPGSIMKPLPGLASTAFVALLLAVIVYYVNNQSFTKKDIMRATSQLQQLDNQSNVSYSFFLAVGATVASLINIVVGSLTLFLADKCL